MGAVISRKGWVSILLGLVGGLGSVACGGGGSGSRSTIDPVTPPDPVTIVVGPYDPLPGVKTAIVGVTGGSGSGGSLKPGDHVTVRFTCEANDGTPLHVPSLFLGQIYLSGPSNNYQLVLPPQYDVATHAVYVGSGVWAYTFVDPIPSVYPAPVNDSPAFGASDGELQGEALLDGTYTVGLQTTWTYALEGGDKRDSGAATYDLRLGSSGAIEHREVVSNASCNACHTTLRAHGGTRIDVETCVLCHTSGAEDRNVPSVAGGTPGVSVDFRVMIHAIHNGKHLPSVLGVATNSNGSRNYAATPKPLEYVGYMDSLSDLSEVGWPIMPSAYVAYIFDTLGTTYQRAEGNGPMPRDAGYGALAPAQKYLEDQVRTGAVQCAACHGNAAQGDRYMTQPSRRACGSCHDDIDWSLTYSSNGSAMPPQSNDDKCVNCHSATGGSLPIQESHLHPYSNPALNTGINLHVLGVSGGTGMGRHQLGDAVTATFDVKDDAGADIPIYQTTRGQAIVIGPTTNPQVLAGNVTLFDSSFRKSTPFTGAGTITALTIAATALDRVYAVVFTATNTFDVVTFDRTGAAFATLLSSQVVPQGGSLPVSLTGLSFTVNDTGTDFALGDRFFMEVIPVASSYTKAIPFDVSLEDLGAVPAGFPTTVTVANTPLYWGRQVVMESALTGAPGTIGAGVPIFGRYATVDTSVMTGLARRDYVVLDYGLSTEEIVRIGRIQTTDDTTGNDLGASDRLLFATTTRFPHLLGATIQEVTLTNRREGVDYTVPTPNGGQLILLAGPGAWSSTANRVVVNYRTDLRFGRRRFPGDAIQDAALDAPADTDDIEQSWGDWKGLPYLHGTYSVGFWINRDYTASGNLPATPTGESTGYRMISPPATKDFLYGANSGALAPRPALADSAACDTCHGDLQAHGNGRRGLGTCLMCHTVSGLEDGPRFTIGSGTNPDFDAYATSFVPKSPGATMDFRQLVHKIHMGKELANGAQYTVVGVFLGVPYPANYADVGFPAMPGGPGDCVKCHGASDSWKAPAPRVHPNATTPTRVWRAVCGACHDSSAAQAHIDVQTSVGGGEACDVCHGAGRAEDVVRVHLVR